jgi:hypothetical protein
MSTAPSTAPTPPVSVLLRENEALVMALRKVRRRTEGIRVPVAEEIFTICNDALALTGHTIPQEVGKRGRKPKSA